MSRSESSDDVLFDPNSLRLVIGALAFAFPTVVIALTGKITTSISASYHELETRDVFVGFLFILGALLISYQGHLQGEPRQKTQSIWSWVVSLRWIKVYQEDIVSTIGGFAAIFTALYPTARDGDPIDPKSMVHTVGAFILFAAVVYFSLVAFLRSLNKKLVDDRELDLGSKFMKRLSEARSRKKRTAVTFLLVPWNFLTLEIQTFLAIAKHVFSRYDRGNVFKNIARLLCEYEKKFSRGITYVVCGAMIALTLVAYLLLLVVAPGRVAGSVTTFVVETVALLFFGAAWITASRMEYISQIISWLSRSRKSKAAAQPEAA